LSFIQFATRLPTLLFLIGGDPMRGAADERQHYHDQDNHSNVAQERLRETRLSNEQGRRQQGIRQRHDFRIPQHRKIPRQAVDWFGAVILAEMSGTLYPCQHGPQATARQQPDFERSKKRFSPHEMADPFMPIIPKLANKPVISF
jgi:hypothetical protein